MKHLILALALLAACGKRDNEEHPATPTAPVAVADKGDLYCELSKPTYDAQKYVASRCDGAGFTSLYAVGCAQNAVDLSIFQDLASGEMFRDPAHQCYPADSKSSYSKDHVLMRMVAAWVQKDKVWVDKFLAFVESRQGRFCDASDNITQVSRCAMSLGLYATLYKMQERLHGGAPLTTTKTEQAPEDFEGHLRMWFIWLQGQVYGGIKDSQLADLKALSEREPENALYRAAWDRYRDGDVTRTFELLADTKHWPEARLPASDTEHCTDYLFQRDMLRDGQPNKDWLPCPTNDDGTPRAREEHAGIEYNAALFVATYAGEYKREGTP